MTERQARGSGRPILVGKRLMKNVGRARERSETDGLMKVLVDAETTTTGTDLTRMDLRLPPSRR